MSLTSSHPRAIFAATAIAASLIGCAGAAGAAVRAHPARGTVTGTITDRNGQPIQGICVVGLRALPFPATNSHGVYRVKVRPGFHRLWFSTGCGTTAPWIAQNYTNGKFPFKPAIVQVKAGKTVTANASLTLGGAVTGQVTGRHGGLAGICVLLVKPSTRYKASPLLNNIFMISGGKPFSLNGVIPGKYRVQFTTTTCGTTGNYANQFWHSAVTSADATVVTVRRGAVVSGIDQRLPAGAVVTGTVTAQGGGPLAGVCVALNEQGWSPDVDVTTRTHANGHYRAQALTTGKYTVSFDPSCDGAISTPYQSQTYPHQVPVTDGKVTRGIDASLATGG